MQGTGAIYQWTGPNSFSQTTQNPSIANVTSAANGTYSLTLTLNECTSTATTSVSVKPLPTVSASSNTPICQGQTLTLSSVNSGIGATYAWSGPKGFNFATQNPSITNVGTATS